MGILDAPFGWYLPDDDSFESFFRPNSYLPGRQVAEGGLAIDDSTWGLNAGFLWTFAESWSLGAFFARVRSSASFMSFVPDPLSVIYSF